MSSQAVSLNINAIVQRVWTGYQVSTPSRTKILDGYLVFIMLTGIAQFAYCTLVGTFPMNSFLSGFISTVTTFVLTASLRIQTDPLNSDDFKNLSPERAFADYCFCIILLHFVVVNFLG